MNKPILVQKYYNATFVFFKTPYGIRFKYRLPGYDKGRWSETKRPLSDVRRIKTWMRIWLSRELGIEKEEAPSQ